jgi:DNA polymerase-1
MQGSIIQTPDKLRTWLSTLSYDCVALDTETTSLNYLQLDIIGVSLSDDNQVCYIDCWSKYKEPLLEILREEIPKIRQLVCHNISFDAKVLYKLGISHTTNIVCTMTAMHLLDENGPKGLKDLAQRYLGATNTIGYEKAIVLGYKAELFYQYACNDAKWTIQLWRLIEPWLKEQQLYSLFFDIEMPFQYVLRDLEVNGVLIDRSALDNAEQRLRKEWRGLQLACFNAGGIKYQTQHMLFGDAEYVGEINLDSPSQLSKFIVGRLNVQLTQQSESGREKDLYTVDKAVLEGLRDTHPFFSRLLDYRAVSKVLNTFLEKLPLYIDSDGRVRASFNNCVARTGRLSSSNPNMQQLPRPDTVGGCVRELLIPKPGYVFLAADYSGQELRVLAEVSRDPTMIGAFIAGQDVHLTTANDFFELGIPNELLFTAHPGYPEVKKKFEESRSLAKTINFGISYGKTATGFAKDWNVSKDEAQKTIDNYFDKFPRIKAAIEKCTQQVIRHGYVRNLAGRIRRLESGQKRSYRQAFNFLIQGYSADMIKQAAIKVFWLLQKHPEWDCRIVLSVHDELVYEIKEEYADVAIPLIKYEMEHAVSICVPLVVDIHKGKNYAEAK